MLDHAMKALNDIRFMRRGKQNISQVPFVMEKAFSLKGGSVTPNCGLFESLEISSSSVNSNCPLAVRQDV